MTDLFVSGDELRAIMSHVPSPVTVITTASAGEIRGMTAGSFTSVCLEPPLVSFNVTRTSGMYRVIKDASHCVVHLLSDRQSDLATWFAIPDIPGHEQFADLEYRLNADGMPVIDGTLGVLNIRLEAAHPAGDTVLFVAEVTAFEEGEPGRPLLYYESGYRSIGGPAEENGGQSPLPAVTNSSSSDAPETPTPKNAKS